jgi:hypothetical protein
MQPQQGKPKALTFEDFAELSRRALEAVPIKKVDEFGRLHIPKYQVLTDEDDRQGLKQAVSSIVSKAHKHGIKCTIADGFSSKPAAQFFLMAWDRMHPETQRPHLISLGDCLVDEPGKAHVETQLERLGNQRITSLARGEKVEEAAERLRKRFSTGEGIHSLMDYQNEPILLLTEYVNSGKTFKALENVFRHLGFSKIHYATLVLNGDQYLRGPNRAYKTAQDPFVGAYVSADHDDVHPVIPWLHLRSDTYNELKKPDEERDSALLHGKTKTMAQAIKELRMLAEEI